MLACLPASGDLTTRLRSRTQMNTGLQKWETTQKMRSANYPTPAELDAYAKKVANAPLSIQIFPNSVKVPQRKHIRRTVNGLDTSTTSQRHSPYPSQVSASAGLLAVLRAPAKGVIKESDGSRARLLHKAVMNPHAGPYGTQSTLNLPQPVPHAQGPSQPQAQTMAAQKQGMAHPQTLQQQQQSLTHPMTLQQSQTMPHHQALQQRSMAHPEALHRQQSLSQPQGPQQQRLAHPPGIQRQQSVPHTQALLQQQQQQQQQHQQQQHQQQQQQQHLSHLHTLQHQTGPQQALLTQQAVTQDLRHVADGAQLPSMQHSQGPASSQLLPQAVGAGPNSLQQPTLAAYGPRKLADADAPPNVTVSTSTIPLSMAASLHQNRSGDLSSIVHQINQLCQARAGMGATSVCEGQIANPSPISRNLLINASSRVSSHHPGLGPGPSCLMVGPPDKALAQAPHAALHSHPNIGASNGMPGFHSEAEKVQQHLQHQLHQQKQQQQQMQHLQQLQQQQRSWAQHQLAHMQQPPEGAQPCKNPRREPPSECGFPSRTISYSQKMPSAAQSFPLKHSADKTQSSSPVNCPLGPMPYMNGHYMQPPWAAIPATAGNNGSGPQDLPVGFQGRQAAASAECGPGAKYRPGKGGPAGPSKMMQNVDFLGGDYQIPGFQEPNMDAMEKMHRSTLGQGQEPGSGGGVHPHHPGY
ncbi:protein FAM222B-like [Genypterus blacodes]|uniref:protein FAM222B-like n=1 Tax=Genypterus blacodes TaxID=154954 RepID=UPI003F75840E